MINATPHRPEQKYRWRFSVTEAGSARPASTVRERVAGLLLLGAKKLLGGYVLHVQIETDPAITKRESSICIMRGFDETQRLLKLATEHQAAEALFRRTHAWMFDDQEAK